MAFNRLVSSNSDSHYEYSRFSFISGMVWFTALSGSSDVSDSDSHRSLASPFLIDIKSPFLFDALVSKLYYST